MGTVEAVESGGWVGVGGDTGISEVIDPKGNIVSRLGLDNQGVVSAEIGAPLDTPYLHWGVWWLLALALAALVAGLLPQRHGARGWRSRRGRAGTKRSQGRCEKCR